jgi:hypothetical protein
MVVEGATCSERPWSSGTRLPMMRPLKTLRCKRHGLDRVVFAVETKWGRCSQEIAAGDATPQYLGWETQSASPIADEVVFATRAAAPLAHEVAAGNGADEPPAWDRRWYELLAENDRRLRAGDWSAADREAQRLLRGAVERSPPRRAAFTGVSQAAYQRAIALTGLGRLEEARWFAVIARAFDGRILSIMAYRHGQQEYGEHGRQVDAWIREAVSHWEAVPPVSVTCASEEPEPGFVPPAKRSGEPPVDRGAPDEEGGDFGAAVVSFVVDEEGVPRFPDIDMKQLYNARIDHLWATVEAVREWRFEPARRDGEPVPCRYTVAAAFHPHGS